MSDSHHNSDWFRLDNAAKIYPPAYTDLAPEVFRVGVTLTEPVRLDAMQRALERTINRCPYYQVHLKRGLFWYYLQRHQRPPRIELLGADPVSRIRMRATAEQLFRVFVRDRLVRIDFSHVLTDGFGAFRFLSTMVAEYLRQRGINVPSGGLVLDPDDPPDPDESEDAYPKFDEPGTPKPLPFGPAYHLPGNAVRGYHRILTARVPVPLAVAKAREFKVSLTELLAGIYIHSILQIWRAASRKPRKRRVIRVEVPADMRRIFPSQTMRNFSLFVLPGIDLRLGDYSLPEIIATVHHMMRLQLDPREIRRQIARNVGGERMFIVRVIPLLLKDLYLSSLHNRLGGNLASGVISNLGNIEFPDEMSAHISDVTFILGPNPTLRKAMSIASYRDELNIAFGSVIESRELERLFFSTLANLGLPVRLSEQTS
jgi:hypothetical protein